METTSWTKTSKEGLHLKTSRFTPRFRIPSSIFKLLQVGLAKKEARKSPVPHLLTTNAAPTEEEVSLVSDLLSSALIEASCLRQQLTETKNVDIVRTKLYSITTFIEGHRAILSHVRQLPPELLQLIFEYTLPSAPYTSSLVFEREWHSVTELPWGLSQVSRSWRSAAVQSTVLWRRLPSIDLASPSTRSVRYLGLLTELLERTRHGPIDIHLYNLVSEQPQHPALDLLLLHSKRWRKARIELFLFSFRRLEPLKGKVPLLEELIINVGDKGVPEELNNIDLFQCGPKLCRVAIYNSYNGNFLLPLSNLSEFWQESGHAAQALDALKSHRSLKILSITRLLQLKGTSLWPLVRLNNLVSLRIRFHFETHHQQFLSSLTLPVIEEIRLHSGRHAIIQDVSSLLMRSRVPSTLKFLYLRTSGVMQEPNQLTALLQLTPFLTHLNVNMPPIEDIRGLIESENGARLVPVLEVCEFLTSSVQGLRFREQMCTLDDFSKSRCEIPSSHLLALYVHFDSLIDREYKCLAYCHGWHIRNHDEVRLLHAWRRELELYTREELYSREIHFSRAKEWLDIGGPEYPLQAFKAVETMNITNPEDILVSGMLEAMIELSNMLIDPPEELFVRARNLIKKWDTLLQTKPELLRWVILRNSKTLIYISQVNPIRHAFSASRLMSEISYKDLEPGCRSWPRYDF